MVAVSHSKQIAAKSERNLQIAIILEIKLLLDGKRTETGLG